MACSSSKSSVCTFSGERFLDWSRLMKERLTSEGLWPCVEEGFRSEQELSQAKENDAKALFLIHRSLSPIILMAIYTTTTAKEAWDALHSIFLPHTDQMNEDTVKLMDEASGEFVKRSDEDGVLLLSGDKPFFDMLLTNSALETPSHMNFPSRVDSLLPSTNIVAKVRFFGKSYEIYFYGRRKQKSFGAGWKTLLDEHDMKAGDFLVFEIVESTDSKLEMNMQVLSPYIPPEMEQEMRNRGIQLDHNHDHHNGVQ